MSAGSPPESRLDGNGLPISWVAALFALLAGTTMTLVPYEFDAMMFREIFPHIRWVGLAMLVAGVGMATGAVYSGRARAVDFAGRIAFVAGLGTYWWQVSVLANAVTGLIVYPTLVLALLAELHPRFREGGLFPRLILAIDLSFGALVLAAPGATSRVTSAAIDAHLPWLGLGLVAAGVAMAVALVRRPSGWLERSAHVASGVCLGPFAVSLALSRSWVGFELYAVLALANFVVAVRPRLLNRHGVRARLLRAMAVAGLVPLFAVGAVTSLLAQREIGASLRDRMARTAEGEAYRLHDTLSHLRQSLARFTKDEGLREAFEHDDRAAVAIKLQRISTAETVWSGFLLIDGTSSPLASRWGDSVPEATRRALRQSAVDGLTRVSSSFRDARGDPSIAIAVPIRANPREPAVLIGTLSLDAVEHQAHSASPYRMRVVDRADWRVVADDRHGSTLRRLGLNPADLAAMTSQGSGPREVIDDGENRVLLAHALVPGSSWVVVATQELSEAFAPVSRISVVVLGLVALAAMLALLLSHLLGNELVVRIAAVRDAAQSLAQGDLGVRTGVSGGAMAGVIDELTTLARAFDEMAGKLERDQVELARVNEELLHALEARDALTASLTHADRRKDEFLAMVAHELRNPLAALSAALATMERRSSADPSSRELRQVGRRQVAQLVRLVDDLLDVSRITRGKIELRRTIVDLCQVVRDAVETLRTALEEKGHALAVSLPDGELPVDGDPTRLEQVVSNLLSNAIKYTPPRGHISIRAYRQPRDDGTTEAEVLVQDDGQGIRADVLPHVFDLFVQGHTPLDRREAGLGLGLTLVRTLTTMHGGTVQVQSEGLGRGSTFTLRFPLGTDRPAAPAPLAPLGDDPTAQRRHLVIVDDNEDAALSLKELLESYGHRVDIAYDGERGRDLILSTRPYLAFVDLGLPRIDGYEVARAVRHGGQSTRLVALTGYGGDEVTAAALAAGFDRHLTKPFRLEELDALGLNVEAHHQALRLKSRP